MLVTTVVGSGIMADRLTDDVALALLGNTIPTGAILVVLITCWGGCGRAFQSGGDPGFRNPARNRGRAALAYVAAQRSGGAGVVPRDAMFDLPISRSPRRCEPEHGHGLPRRSQFGLVFTILAALAVPCGLIPWLVGLYITAAYWFTASTSFANPAVAIARAYPTPSRASGR